MKISLCMNLWEFFRWHGYGKILAVVYGHAKNFGCGKILVVVTFWWGIDFLLLDIDFFRCMGIFGHVGLGYGN